jgi:radical SAM protein with 4Fe4S-binding SPASM domain
MLDLRISTFSVQWHITTRCGNRCRHCYMYDESTYFEERENELSTRDLMRVLGRIDEFEEKWRASVRHFALTGGDPLLRPDWQILIRELRSRGKVVRILGNPETLSEDNLSVLAEQGVHRFQLSIDGLESTHDSLRGEGSFRRTLAGIEKLESHGIACQVMFTLNPENKEELIPLLTFLAENTSLRYFAFDVVSQVGNARQFQTELSPEAMLKLFREYLQEKRRLKQAGYRLSPREKPHLFKVLHVLENDRYLSAAPYPAVFSGCLVGWTCAPVLADGSVLACRRFPEKVGKLPEQSFEEILFGSPILRRFRRAEYYEGCGECAFFRVCRGCPAVVFGLTGNPLAKNPMCFKDCFSEAGRLPVVHNGSLPMDASFQQEHDLIARHLFNLFNNNFGVVCQDTEVSRAILLLRDPSNRKDFRRDPRSFCDRHGLRLNEMKQLLISTYDVLLKEEHKREVEKKLFLSLFSHSQLSNAEEENHD